MLTRFEVFRASRGVKMAELVAESGYHRSHVFRIRHATTEPSRDAIAAMVSAMRRLTLEDVHAEILFELSIEESGPWRRDFSNQLAREVAAYRRERRWTATILRDLMKQPRASWLTALARTSDGISEAVSRAAALEGRRLLNANPAAAEALFELAGTVADMASSIAPAEYRSFLSGRARLERANALRQLGAFETALELLSDAEERFAGVAMCTHELGRAWFARGSILFKMNGLDDAERWLRLAANIFAATADQRRLALVRVVEANVRFERGDWIGARDLWVTTIPTLEAARDRHTLGSTWLNLGWCHLELGEPDAATQWLDRARATFTKLSSRTDLARTRWASALVEARYSRGTVGVESLRGAESELEQLGMLTEAGMVDLDIAEILLLHGGRSKEVITICRRLVTGFTRAGAQKELMKTFAYLREAVETGDATPELVQSIRREVKRAMRERSYAFDAAALRLQ